MISYISNLNLNAANTIFNKYIPFLINELDSNNKLLESEKTKVPLIGLPSTDQNYIFHAMEDMIQTNNSYIALLSSFQKEYAALRTQNLRPIVFHSSQSLSETLDIHRKNIF